MNKIFILLLFLFVSISAQFVEHRNIYDFFSSTTWNVFSFHTQQRAYTDETGATFNLTWIESDTVSNTIISKVMKNQAYGNKVVYITVETDSADTTIYGNPLDNVIDVNIDIGVFSGIGTVSGTPGGTIDASGYTWFNIIHVTQDTSIQYILSNSTWWRGAPTNAYKYRFDEQSPGSKQRNKYLINEFTLRSGSSY